MLIKGTTLNAILWVGKIRSTRKAIRFFTISTILLLVLCLLGYMEVLSKDLPWKYFAYLPLPLSLFFLIRSMYKLRKMLTAKKPEKVF
jgi:hypothetical protein